MPGLGRLGRTGRGRARHCRFPTHSPPWRRVPWCCGAPASARCPTRWVPLHQVLRDLGVVHPPVSQLAQGKALEQRFSAPEFAKLSLERDLPRGVSLSRSDLPSLGRRSWMGPRCYRPTLGCSPGPAAGPEPTSPCRERGRSSLCTPQPWGCGVGAVRAVQPVTNSWSYSGLVSPVFVSAGRGPALPAGYCGYGWGVLAMPPSSSSGSCQAAVPP